ncbi:MAG: RND transporter [Alphaproteobacteria bacterium]
MEWLDKIPTGLLVVAAVLMLLAPFFPEPHLVQKFHMLMAGTLKKPIDIFDVFWHLTPSVLLVIKLWRAA